MTKYISSTETAKIIRKVLKEKFTKKDYPALKFRVYQASGGSTLYVEWTDGPSKLDVESLVKMFEGAKFDGMTDLKSSVYSIWEDEEVRFGSDYINCKRYVTRAFVDAIVDQFCARHHADKSKIRFSGNDIDTWVDAINLGYHDEHALSDLLRGTDEHDMHRAYEADTERVEREHAEWVANEPARKAKEEQEQAEWQCEHEEMEREFEQKRAEKERKLNEEARRQQEQRQRSAFSANQRQALYSREHALAYFGLRRYASKSDVVKAFREKVRSMADGKGGYSGDMDLLVQVKEKALQ